MKKLLFVLLGLVVLIGLYRGWLSISRSEEGGKVSVTVDPDKAKEDVSQFKETATDIHEKAKDAAN